MDCVKLGKKNSVNFWRVLFTFCIMLFHYAALYPELYAIFGAKKHGWNIAVEFFFIVSGFLLAYKCQNTNLTTNQYTWARIKRLYPMYILSNGIMFFLQVYKRQLYTGKAFGDYLFHFLDEALMIQSSAITYQYVNGVTWYISSMLICGYVIYHLYKNYRDLFTKVIAPVVTLFLYGFMANTVGALGKTSTLTPIYFSYSIIRGCAGMNLGVLCYEVYLRFCRLKLSLAGEVLARLVEICSFAVVIYYTFMNGSTINDFLCLVLLFAGVFIAFSHNKANIIFNNPVVDYLSKISLAIYVLHIFVRDFIYVICEVKKYSAKNLVIYVLTVVVLAAVVNKAMEIVVPIFNKAMANLLLQKEE